MKKRKTIQIHGPDEPGDPEVVRGFFPEMSRCDKCGVLDERTERVGLLEDRTMYWLHSQCIVDFVVMRSELVHDRKGHRIGVVMSHDRGETWEAWQLVNNEPIYRATVGAGECEQKDDRVNMAVSIASKRHAPPYPGRGWLGSQKFGRALPLEDFERTKASQEHWKKFRENKETKK
jgi:hypothetical protein